MFQKWNNNAFAGFAIFLPALECVAGSSESISQVASRVFPTHHSGWDAVMLHCLCFALQPGRNLLLTCLFGVLYFSLSATLETNKLQGKKLELGNELIASLDAEVRNTQLSGRASDQDAQQGSEHNSAPSKSVPSSVLQRRGPLPLIQKILWKKRQKRTHSQRLK